MVIASYNAYYSLLASYSYLLENFEFSVLHGSVLEQLLYLVYVTYILQLCKITITHFDGDIAILSMGSTQIMTTAKLQTSLHTIAKWTTMWQICLNLEKLVHAIFILRLTDG